MTDGVRTTRMLLDLGKTIEMEHHFYMAKREDVYIPKFQSDIPYFQQDAYFQLHKQRMAQKLASEGKENWMPEWTQGIRARVGAYLMDALMKVAKVTRTMTGPDGETITEDQAAFITTYRYEHGCKIGIVQVNPSIREKMAKEPMRDSLHARHMPMLVQPKPWLAHNSGGYIYSRSPYPSLLFIYLFAKLTPITGSVMRLKESNEQFSYLKVADAEMALELVYLSLNILGKTPWKINKDVFEVALKAWNAGEGLPRLPPLNLVQETPAPPTDPGNVAAKVAYQQKLKALAQERASNHSDRCSVNYKIEIARTVSRALCQVWSHS